MLLRVSQNTPFSNGCEINRFFNNVFNLSEIKKHFCIIIEFKFAKTGKIIIAEDSQIQWMYRLKLVCQLKKNMAAILRHLLRANLKQVG